MTMIRSLMICQMVFISLSPLAGQNPNEEFPSAVDIGHPALKGDSYFSLKLQNWVLTGAGTNMWNNRDEFYFRSRVMEGDCIFSASLAFVGEGIEPHRKAGLMFRSDLGEDAPYVDVAVHGDGLTSLQFRTVRGGETREFATQVRSPGFIQLQRSGNTFILRVSKDQTPLDEVASVTVELGDSCHAGMFVCSHNPGIREQAVFSNVRIDRPAETCGGDQAPPSPSRLEILDVTSGMREIVYYTQNHIEAPNWSKNGKYLIFNREGKLYRFDLKKRTPVLIPTGFATSNNNDHGISPDGKWLAISHHVQEGGNRHSRIFTVPVRGGTPVQVTPSGPSYWHGWSPDGKWLVYCAERNGNYDVYKIPSQGGQEIRLTDHGGLDDGPEYAPDGKTIWFNSERSGTMQIWKMKPDGSGQQQATADQFNNWFAHPSPDGKWIVFITYRPDVPAGSHPRNQPVMIRIMPVEGGAIRSLAFLYGGQGTLNVPSWSPDSRKIAFVSYTY